MPEPDPLAAIDARISALRSIRASAPRFSDAYWEADDLLAWLRVARDDVLRAGRIQDEIVAFLETPPTTRFVESPVLVSAEATLDPAAGLAVLEAPTDEDELPEPETARSAGRRRVDLAQEPVRAA